MATTRTDACILLLEVINLSFQNVILLPFPPKPYLGFTTVVLIFYLKGVKTSTHIGKKAFNYVFSFTVPVKNFPSIQGEPYVIFFLNLGKKLIISRVQ